MGKDEAEIQELQDRATISVSRVRALVESWIPRDAALPNALLSSLEKRCVRVISLFGSSARLSSYVCNRPVSLYKPSSTPKASGHAGQARLKGALLAKGRPSTDSTLISTKNGRGNGNDDDDEAEETKAAASSSKKRPSSGDALSQYLNGSNKKKNKSKRK
jgi:hypothetical protein